MGGGIKLIRFGERVLHSGAYTDVQEWTLVNVDTSLCSGHQDATSPTLAEDWLNVQHAAWISLMVSSCTTDFPRSWKTIFIADGPLPV